MNLVLDQAEELDMKRKQRKPLGIDESLGIHWRFRVVLTACDCDICSGRILLKGDNITLLMNVGG